MTGWTVRTTCVALATTALAAVLLTGCRGDGVAAPQPTTSAVATTSVTAVPPSPEPSAPSTTEAGTEAATPTPTPTPSTAPSNTPTPSGTASAWPDPVLAPAPRQVVWAVYLAVGHSNSDAAVVAAARRADRAGYDAVLADPACEAGALEALKLDRYDFWTTAELYFGSSAKAAAFTDRWRAEGGATLATLRVTVGCQD